MSSRTPLANLSAAQLNALPRTTRWRAQKRGWVALDYRTERAHWRVNAAPDFELAAAYALAGKIVSAKLPTMAIPSYLDRSDLIQECVIELWRVSAKPDAYSRKWQVEVMCRRLLQLQARCKGDRDRFTLCK